jgi:endonuclease-3
MAKKDVGIILRLLDENYGTEYKCFLNHKNSLELLVATILSAQCTDNRVNQVTESLFKKYRNVYEFANANLAEFEEDIKSTGFYHNKAKNIIMAANMIIKDFDGSVPRELGDLLKLPGVGRKTANVIRGNIYHEESIVVDTHVKRISKKLGFTKSEDPVKIEFDLMKILPKDHWILYNIQIITHGRSICTARNPGCDRCFLSNYCNKK